MDLENITGFEWDEGNKYKSEKKHKVSIKEAEEVFESDPLITIKTGITHEERYQLFGQTKSGKLISVIFTLRNNKIRVISARPQSQKERNFYNGKLKEEGT